MRSFDKYVSADELARKRQLADELRADPEKFRRYQAEARRRLAEGDAQQANEEGKRERPTPLWQKALPLVAGAVAVGVWLAAGKVEKHKV